MNDYGNKTVEQLPTIHLAEYLDLAKVLFAVIFLTSIFVTVMLNMFSVLHMSEWGYIGALGIIVFSVVVALFFVKKTLEE